MVRKRISFTGMVQGVGFRWRTRMAAESLGLTGWVRNEWDGSVTMEVQGEAAAIDRMLAMIDSGSFIHIDDMDVEDLPTDPKERKFKVVGY